MSGLPFDIERASITVIGAARSGMGAVRLLHRHRIAVFLSEGNTPDRHPGAAEELATLGIPHEFGGHSERVFDATVMVVSPGVPSNSWVVSEALGRGIPVFSELELAAYFCPAPAIAITGTNGKTTTTALTGAMFATAGIPAIVAGNIGTAFTDAVEQTGGDAAIAVLEVSSFQLDHTIYFHPRTAMITTITPDHLARYHGRYEEYIASKQRVFKNQDGNDALIYNLDSADTSAAILTAMSRPYPVSLEQRPIRGAWREGDALMLNVADEPERIARVDALLLRGPHNHMNIMMAALAARLHGVDIDAIAETARSFPGVEHRLEFVRTLDGVDYVNDSKATNVDSVVIALRSFEQPVVLIAGGRDKDAPYDPLFDLIARRVRAAVLIGEAADRMAAALDGRTALRRAADMDEAVRVARSLAASGDTVLLSPACASFDMFTDYEHRGRVFKQLVAELHTEHAAG